MLNISTLYCLSSCLFLPFSVAPLVLCKVYEVPVHILIICLFIETSYLQLKSTQNEGRGQDSRQSVWEPVNPHKFHFMNGRLCHVYGKTILMSTLNSLFTEVEGDRF